MPTPKLSSKWKTVRDALLKKKLPKRIRWSPFDKIELQNEDGFMVVLHKASNFELKVFEHIPIVSTNTLQTLNNHSIDATGQWVWPAE